MRKEFIKMRIATFLWGFLVVYFFTGRLDVTSLLFLTQVAGNTIIMWFFTREK